MSAGDFEILNFHVFELLKYHVAISFQTPPGAFPTK